LRIKKVTDDVDGVIRATRITNAIAINVFYDGRQETKNYFTLVLDNHVQTQHFIDDGQFFGNKIEYHIVIGYRFTVTILVLVVTVTILVLVVTVTILVLVVTVTILVLVITVTILVLVIMIVTITILVLVIMIVTIVTITILVLVVLIVTVTIVTVTILILIGRRTRISLFRWGSEWHSLNFLYHNRVISRGLFRSFCILIRILRHNICYTIPIF
jgi:hypothetical protein